MKRYKMIFSDIDGTLLNSRHQITQTTKETLKSLWKKEIPIVLASSRMPEGILSLQKELEIEGPIICYGGGLVLGNDEEVIKSFDFSTETALEIKNDIRTVFPAINTSIYSFRDWIAENKEDIWIKQETAITSIEPVEMKDIEIIAHFETVHKLMCMGEAEDIKKAELFLKEKYSNYTIYRSKDTYLEIMDEKALKSNAMKILCEKYGTSREETIAFGDSFNDLDMLQSAGCGVAMGNAVSEVKKAADIITSDNNHDGIAEILKEIYII